MPAITALLHTRNDFLRLGRALETLHPCDEILVVDHGSTDGTSALARDYGATVVNARTADLPAAYPRMVHSPWLLCLLPCETLSEALAASLFEWKLYPPNDTLAATAWSVAVREETANGWVEAEAVTRFVPRNWVGWEGTLPTSRGPTRLFDGYLLRFRMP
jgi:glycosyltransferase involved in cell wall biosynthesis